MDFESLREKYPEFIYKSFSYELSDGDLIVRFLFEMMDISFNPILRFKKIDAARFEKLDKKTVENFVFNLGLAEIPSYWKSTCSQKIVIEAGMLDDYQIGWWKNLLLKGMGQFFYENNINFTDTNFVSIESKSKKKYSSVKETDLKGILVPVGGGKDSAVTLDITLKDEKKVWALLVNPTQAALDIVRASGVFEKIVVERIIDPKLLELNSKGYLNGHTPFSSVIAFLSVFVAQIYGFDQVILSNERSSDEENTSYLNRKINHQYSKTLEFENNFRNYIKKYLTDVNYFSLLRPLYEIQIAKIFSEMPKYFDYFRSCNIGQRTNSWCRNCAKCLSTYILLKPFFSNKVLIKIFKEDLIQKPKLKETLSELINKKKVKPFECVGTRQELKDALNSKLEILKSWNPKNNLPEKYERKIRQIIQG